MVGKIVLNFSPKVMFNIFQLLSINLLIKAARIIFKQKLFLMLQFLQLFIGHNE